MTAGEHVALVTGGSRGIGEVIARRLAGEGVAVLIAARDAERCKVVAEELGASGGRAWPLPLDVTDPASVREAADQAQELAGGPVDWLVNNAGSPALHRILKPREGDEDVYERQLALNFHGARRMVEALLPGMVGRGYGRIVAMASSAGLVGYPNLTAYCASKHALVGYTRALSQELEGTGVEARAVCPHYVASTMIDEYVQAHAARTDQSEEHWREWFAQQNPGGRLVGVEECADAVLEALAGDDPGVILELDGSQGVQRRS